MFEFIEKCGKIHKNRFDYSLVEYKNSKEKVKIICRDHGEFYSSPSVHLRTMSGGCPKCIGHKSIDYFKELSNKIHNFKGDRYDYSLVSFKSIREKVEIICRKHGSFLQEPFSHYQKQGCPKCKSSKGEERIIEYLISNKIQYEYQKKFEGLKNQNYLPFDFYLPDYNLCIEYDGEHHFEPVGVWGGLESFEVLKENDCKKDFFCRDMGINLLRIAYYDFDNIESIIGEFLTNLPKKLISNYRLPRKSDDFSSVLGLFGKIPIKVKLNVKPNCLENNCHNNVDKYVNMYGGMKITGYYLVYDIDYDRFIAIRHSVWKNSYDDIIDITPFSDGRKWNLFIESDRKETYINFNI